MLTSPVSEKKERPSFSGKFGMIRVAAGSAVGLGNIWRFPYLAHEYGGGLFLLVYFILVLTFGFSLMITELVIGRRTGKSCIGAVMTFSRKHKWFGWLMLIPPALILPYYCVIGGWVTDYAFQYAVGAGSSLVQPGYFDSFIACEGDFLTSPVVWFFIFGIITAIIVAMGLEKGIERIGKVLMPLLLLIMVCLLVYIFTIPGVMESTGEYLNVDFSELSMGTIIAASGQMFYSLSLAMGIMITLGSYTTEDVSLEKSVTQISLIDTAVAMLSGLLVVPSVMALGGGVVSSGPGLMFETMPLVFGSMPLGDVIGFAFFFLVFIAALTSSMSIMEALVAAVVDHTGVRNINRLKASALVFVFFIAFGMLSCLGYGPLNVSILGMDFLSFFDFLANTIFLPLVAIGICLFAVYVVGLDTIVDEVESSGEFKKKALHHVMIKWVCPILLVLILAFGVAETFGVTLF